VNITAHRHHISTMSTMPSRERPEERPHGALRSRLVRIRELSKISLPSGHDSPESQGLHLPDRVNVGLAGVLRADGVPRAGSVVHEAFPGDPPGSVRFVLKDQHEVAGDHDAVIRPQSIVGEGGVASVSGHVSCAIDDPQSGRATFDHLSGWVHPS
jgi:hypothetical protein